MRKSELTIAFTGQDGTGKSTQADRLEERLRGGGLRVVRYHQYEAITPLGVLAARFGKTIANRLMRRRSARARREAAPASGTTAPSRTDLMERLSAGASLLQGLHRTLLKRLLQRGHDVRLLDRCYSDEIIRVESKFGRGRRLGLWLLDRVVPRPDLVLTFSVDERLGWERKKTRELSFEEYQAKVEVAREITARLDDIWPVVHICVDGRTADEVEALVAFEVSNHLGLDMELPA